MQNTQLLERGIPASRAVRDRLTPQLTEADLVAIDHTDSVDPDIAGTPPSAPAGASGIEDVVRRWGSDVLFDSQEPAEAAKGLVDELTTSAESA